MSRIEQLIEELCPEGVEYKELGEIAKISTGKLNANAMTLDGLYPFFTCSEKPYLIDTFAFDTEAILISGNGSQLGHINYYNGKFNAYQRTYVICEFSTNITASYLLHFLKGFLKEYIWKNVKEGSVPYITLPMLQNFQIPLPPLPIQQEIVRILDTFTALDGSLQAELEARRKQYEHYRNQLLNFDGKEVEWKTLGEVGEFKYGFTDIAKDFGNIRFVRITDINENGKLRVNDCKYLDLTEDNKAYLISRGDILMARTGATYGKTMLFNEDYPAVYASFLIRIRFKVKNIIPEYYWHFSQSGIYWVQANKLVGGGAQPQFNANVLKTIQIPIPPLSEQERIVGILDKFDALVASTSSATGGIPAEIAARRKQYEYYREKLLSFEIKGNK